MIKVFAQPIEFAKGLVNEEQPILKGGVVDEVDRVMLEMGVPLQNPLDNWHFNEMERSDALTYAPVDDDTRVTLKEIQD